MGLKREDLKTDKEVEDYRQAEIDDVVKLICKQFKIRYNYLVGSFSTNPIDFIVADMRNFINSFLLAYGIEKDRDITVHYLNGCINVTPVKLKREQIKITGTFYLNF